MKDANVIDGMTAYTKVGNRWQKVRVIGALTNNLNGMKMIKVPVYEVSYSMPSGIKVVTRTARKLRASLTTGRASNS
jgi:hypothetical protein